MSLETALQSARAIVAKFDEAFILINSLTIFDTGLNTGYVATFEFTESLQSSDEYETFYKYANTFPRTGGASTAEEAIRIAIAKCETELTFKLENPVCGACKDPIRKGEQLCTNCLEELKAAHTGCQLPDRLTV